MEEFFLVAPVRCILTLWCSYISSFVEYLLCLMRHCHRVSIGFEFLSEIKVMLINSHRSILHWINTSIHILDYELLLRLIGFLLNRYSFLDQLLSHLPFLVNRLLKDIFLDSCKGVFIGNIHACMPFGLWGLHANVNTGFILTLINIRVTSSTFNRVCLTLFYHGEVHLLIVDINSFAHHILSSLSLVR